MRLFSIGLRNGYIISVEDMPDRTRPMLPSFSYNHDRAV